ncbi:hypothetical protein KY304_01155 [Candidatus Woesearchaeota archaeon]|nr:hypothetical protein [Candidatus Woesearchaeota archaeon]MBW2978702.1 hypothetical protein [Candidatus Woesearchaeota archaeon]
MAKNEFDKELGTYLSRRKKAEIPDIIGWLKGLIPKPTPPPVNVSMPAEIETYEEQNKKTETKSPVEIVESDKSKNVWEFIKDQIKKFSSGKKYSISEEEQETKIKEIVAKEMMQKDLQAISKIALIAIKKLPEEDRKEFKESAEFEDLKKILKKYELIK